MRSSIRLSGPSPGRSERCEGSVVAQEGPQDTGAPAGERDNGLHVLAALTALLEVEVPVRAFADDAGLRRQVKDPAQTAAIALGPVQVAGATTRVPRNWHQPRRAGQMASVRVSRQVTGGYDELCTEDRAHTGQRFDDLGLRMGAAADDKQLGKTIARYGRVDLLEIDELGYLELDRRGAEMLFQVLTEREEKNSIAIASNEAFTGWSRTFTDPRLCAAIVDRLTFNATIIETGTESYRLARSKAKQNGKAK